MKNQVAFLYGCVNSWLSFLFSVMCFDRTLCAITCHCCLSFMFFEFCCSWGIRGLGSWGTGLLKISKCLLMFKIRVPQNPRPPKNKVKSLNGQNSTSYGRIFVLTRDFCITFQGASDGSIAGASFDFCCFLRVLGPGPRPPEIMIYFWEFLFGGGFCLF